MGSGGGPSASSRLLGKGLGPFGWGVDGVLSWRALYISGCVFLIVVHVLLACL